MAREASPAVRHSMKAHASSLGAVFGVLRGILAAVAVTVLGVVVFALAIQWFSLSNTVISILNQALKLAAIAVGARACVGRGGSNGIFKGALVGLVYMMLGIVAYAFLSGLSLQTSAYLADLGMGIAAGGLCGMILANMKKK